MSGLYYPTVAQNPHTANITELFGAIDGGAFVPRPDQRYIFICFTNRCGSNYLAELIASNGNYNQAGETLNWDTVAANHTAHGFASFGAYFRWLSNRFSKSGCLFIKAAPAQIELLGHAGILDRIAPKSSFILMERADKLAQAISHAIAFGTGRFTSLMQGHTAPQDIVFTASIIDGILNGICKAYWEFDLFFARNGIAPINVTYEPLLADPAAGLRAIAHGLNLPNLDLVTEKLRLQRQSGPISRSWRSQYLAAREAM